MSDDAPKWPMKAVRDAHAAAEREWDLHPGWPHFRRLEATTAAVLATVLPYGAALAEPAPTKRNLCPLCGGSGESEGGLTRCPGCHGTGRDYVRGPVREEIVAKVKWTHVNAKGTIDWSDAEETAGEILAIVFGAEPARAPLPIQCPKCGPPGDVLSRCDSCGNEWYTREQSMEHTRKLRSGELSVIRADGDMALDQFADWLKLRIKMRAGAPPAGSPAEPPPDAPLPRVAGIIRDMRDLADEPEMPAWACTNLRSLANRLTSGGTNIDLEIVHEWRDRRAAVAEPPPLLPWFAAEVAKARAAAPQSDTPAVVPLLTDEHRAAILNEVMRQWQALYPEKFDEWLWDALNVAQAKASVADAGPYLLTDAHRQALADFMAYRADLPWLAAVQEAVWLLQRRAAADTKEIST